MGRVTVDEAQRQLNRLLDEVSESHQPVVISSQRGSAVLVAEEDWRAIQETLHLLQVPGLAESIKVGMATSTELMSDELDW